jgi:GTP-binding protein LepA
MKNIRNFSIIAHIDHGKSTLADRIITQCGGIEDRIMKSQVMDTMDIEKERGITIKAQSVRLKYVKDNQEYILNLIDTPGHVDFSYEVSRSLASSDGALLVVDAAQGIEAQTIANVYIAIENNLELIPVLNKIDLPQARPEEILGEIEDVIGIDCSDHALVSAKSGIGVKELIDKIIDKIPPPQGNINASTKAIIYDSWFDNYLGALALVRVFDGEIKKNQEILIVNAKQKAQVLSLMYPHPLKKEDTDIIKTGEIGIVVLGLKKVGDLQVGDTITDGQNPTKDILDGFEEAKPFVFVGLYPIDTDAFEDLRDALDKLKLNDSSISYEPESSLALGNGFRTGFLGLLHMEVIKERIEREFKIDLIATAPTVIYEVEKTDGSSLTIQNPSFMPPVQEIADIKEPYVKASVITPSEYLGNLIKLLNNKRGIQTKMDYINETRVLLEYEMPMNEVMMDFYDKLKSYSKGYASFDYEFIGYKSGNLKKLDILVAGEVVDSLSVIVPEEKATIIGRDLVDKMKELIPRQLFEVALQAGIGNKIIARNTVKSMGKNVTAKCYGGDISRKRKLLEKQKAGKKRMKSIGKVSLPQDAFMAILKID